MENFLTHANDETIACWVLGGARAEKRTLSHKQAASLLAKETKISVNKAQKIIKNMLKIGMLLKQGEVLEVQPMKPITKGKQQNGKAT